MFKRFFMDRTLKTRITFLYTLFAVALVGGITLYTYNFTAGLLKAKEISILNDSLEYLESQIETRLKAINEEYINIFDDSDFLELYLSSVGKELSQTEQMNLDEAYRDYFLDMQVRNTDLVASIQLVTGDQRVYSDDYRPMFSYQQFIKSPYYKLCMENKNKIMYRDLEENSDYFCILRSFYFMNAADENSTYPGVGYLSEEDRDYSTLVFFLKKEYLQNTIREEAKKRQTSIFILDQDGNVVVQEGGLDWLSEQRSEHLLEEIRARAAEGFSGRMEQDQIGVHIKPIELFDWDVVFVYDMDVIYRQVDRLRNMALLVFVLSVGMISLIASFISATVVKPIHALERSMENAVENNMKVTFTPRYNDEIASLGRKFTALMEQVSRLMEEVKQAEESKRVEELKALQAQINPHFLYNTLDMVYWLAKMDRNEKIANLIADLADFFRLSLNKGEDITSVEREAAHVEKYLEIQRVRMDGKFEYSILMDPAVRECQIPKLILQPFVENALVHGFDGIAYQGQIDIQIVRQGDRIVFTITDNGTGIKAELLDEINHGSVSKSNKTGYAIGNVRDRIHLYAGAGYGVFFDTAADTGTRVQISFPFNFQMP